MVSGLNTLRHQQATNTKTFCMYKLAYCLFKPRHRADVGFFMYCFKNNNYTNIVKYHVYLLLLTAMGQCY